MKRIGMIDLPFVPVPPNLEAVLGYSRDRRFVAFYWDTEEESLCVTDGVFAACGSGYTNSVGWKLFSTHPRITKSVGKLNIYGPDADHALILDREERKFFGATAQDARMIVGGYHIDDLPPVLPMEQMEEFFSLPDDFSADNDDGVDVEMIFEEAQARGEEEAILLAWLDQSHAVGNETNLTSSSGPDN